MLLHYYINYHSHRCKHLVADDSTNVFDGDSQKTRYYAVLKNVFDNIPITIDLGAARYDLGTHSVRKCADTCAINVPGGPGQTVVKLRAGHSLGAVQDCYQKEDPSGDCFCGRVLSLMSMTTEEFALLPPHFDEVGKAKIREIGWNNLLQDYDKYSEKFQRVIPFLLASLVYHYVKGNLKEMLPTEHPIYQ